MRVNHRPVRGREQCRVSPRPCCTTYHHPAPDTYTLLFLFLSFSLSLFSFITDQPTNQPTDRPTDRPTNLIQSTHPTSTPAWLTCSIAATLSNRKSINNQCFAGIPFVIVYRLSRATSSPTSPLLLLSSYRSDPAPSSGPGLYRHCARTEHTWERLRSTSPETPPTKITRLTSPLPSLSSSAPFPSTDIEKKIPHRNYRTRDSGMDGMDSKPVLNDDPSVTLTIRLIMQGKEVGSIIGKKGEIVKRFREESGAKINISDGSCPERIVTVTGPTNSIFKAFTLICKKFEEWCSQFHDIQGGGGAGGGGGVPRPPITLRLIVPASQCGSLIGKGGSKIKEIREVTGASIQVASEMLPNSTERAVTISGTSEAITQCIYHICCVMLESPPKGATIPYRPKPQVGGPVILAGGQAYTIQGNYAVPAHSDMGKIGNNPLAGLAALGLGGLATPTNTGGLNPAALAALAGSQLRTSNTNRQQPAANNQTHEMTVPNELIGCIIGKGGTKIAEIRQISGAMIRISNCEEREGGATDRTITITGNPDAVALAQYLINMSVELQKANLEAQNTQTPGSGTTPGASGASASPSTTTTTASPLASAIPLAQLLSKPGALNALSSLTALGGLTELLGGAAGAAASALPVQTTGVHRSHKAFTPRLRSPGAPGPTDSGKFKSDRTKYNPY